MKRTWMMMLIVALVCALGGWFVGTRAGHHAEAAAEDHDEDHAEVKAPAHVLALPIVRSAFARSVAAYGTVAVATEATLTVAVPFDCRVRSVLVTIGQTVAAGDVLAEVEPSAEARQQYDEALKTGEAARQDLGLAKERQGLKLATMQDLAQAQHAADLAELRLAGLRARGFGEASTAHALRASVAGTIAKIAAQEGQVVAVGGGVLELAPTGKLETRLGLAPADLDACAVGRKIHLVALRPGEAPAADGMVTLLTRALNPITRLVDVVVALPLDAPFVPGEAVRAELLVETPSALVVPRAALVPDDEHLVIFTVAAGKAARHVVTVIAENEHHAAIAGEGVEEGVLVATLGNGVLEDGMAVVLEQADKTEQTAPPAKDEDDDKAKPADDKTKPGKDDVKPSAGASQGGKPAKDEDDHAKPVSPPVAPATPTPPSPAKAEAPTSAPTPPAGKTP